MEISYKLTMNEYVEYELYTVTKNNKNKKPYMSFWLTIPVIGLFSISYGIKNMNVILLIFLFVFSFVWSIFYPTVNRKIYMNSVKKRISKYRQKLLGNEILLGIADNFLYSKDNISESKFDLHAIENIVESPNCFFLYFDKGAAIIIPKANNKKFVEEIVQVNNKPVQNQSDWKF